MSQIEKIEISSIVRPSTLIGDSLTDFHAFIKAELAYLDSVLSTVPKFEYCLDLKESTDSPFNIWLVYEWLPQAFAYTLLLRDTLFTIHKARIFLDEGRISEDKFTNTISELHDKVKQCRSEVYSGLDGKIESLSQAKKITGFYDKWEHQINPLSEYSMSFKKLGEQCLRIKNENESLSQQQILYNKIFHLIRNENNRALEELKYFRTIVESLTDQLTNTDEGVKSSLNKYVTQVQDDFNERGSLEDMPSMLETKLLEFQNVNHVIVGREDADLLSSEFNFSERTLAWLENMVLPIYIQIEQYQQELRSSLKLTMVNLNNYLSVNKEKDMLLDDISPLEDALKKHLVRIEEIDKSVKKNMDRVQELMNSYFKVGNVFNLKTEFLEYPEFLGEQIVGSKDRFESKIRKFFSFVKESFSNVISSVKAEESLSKSEKIVRFIRSRRIEENLLNYANIFLTEGYVGASFAVGRKNELENMRTNYKHWMEGYRGSVALVGNRFCGKTFLAEYFLNSLSDGVEVVKLIPNRKLRYNGRKFNVSTNMVENLSFISKSRDDKKRILWIDDLELFWDVENDILKNVRSLKKFIDDNNDRFLVICAMNDALFEFLKTNIHFHQSFQSIIQCHRIFSSEIMKGLMIRHQATHNSIIDSGSKVIEIRGVQRKLNEIVEASNNNIGEAFKLWCSTIKFVDNKTIMVKDEPIYQLPDVQGYDSNLVIADIYMQKVTNEYRIRKLYGSSFSSTYKDVLKRLINLGVVKRTQNGNLVLNDNCANKLYITALEDNFDYQ